MMKLQRFAALADAYGADLQRWPKELRADADALLMISAQARALLDDARDLDQRLAAASAERDAIMCPQSAQEAALARLRSGVAGRIAWSGARRRTSRYALWAERAFASARGLPLHWIVAAAGGGFAMVAGFLLGANYAAYMSAPVSDIVLAMLQPSPLHILVF